MYAGLMRFTLGRASEAKVQQIVNEIAPLIAVQRGCEDVTVFGNEVDGEYGIYVLWETEGDAELAAGVIGHELDKHLMETVARPETRLFEVIWSK
jgi:heme-degrading monooxygenase HmoA